MKSTLRQGTLHIITHWFVCKLWIKVKTHFQCYNLAAIRIAPGEPVPPGFEGEVKPVAEIQPTLDKCTTKALVGIEYIIELSSIDAKTPCYHCVLCDRSYYRKYEPKAIMLHLLTDYHRIEFLVNISVFFSCHEIDPLILRTFYSDAE